MEVGHNSLWAQSGPRGTEAIAHYPSSPWFGGASIEEMVRETVDSISLRLPTTNLVWGGDRNHNLVGGRERVGSNSGHTRLEHAMQC